jgi:hypothetical protein
MREVRFHNFSIDATTKWLMPLAHLFLAVSLKITVNKNSSNDTKNGVLLTHCEMYENDIRSEKDLTCIRTGTWR